MNTLTTLLLSTGVAILASLLPANSRVAAVLSLVALAGYGGVGVYLVWLSIFGGSTV